MADKAARTALNRAIAIITTETGTGIATGTEIATTETGEIITTIATEMVAVVAGDVDLQSRRNAR